MTWPAQVRHVFVRNAIDTRLTLAIGIALIVVITVLAVTGQVLSFGTALVLDYAVRIALLLHVALVIEADPPPTPGGFWATQPRLPSAVATAKLLHVLLVLLLLTAAALVTHVAWHFGSEALWPALGAQFRHATITILPVLLLASLFPSQPRSGIGAAMIGLSYGNLAEQESRSGVSMMRPVWQVVERLPMWAWIPVFVVLIAVFFWRYRRAEMPRRAGIPLTTLVLVPYALLLQRDDVARGQTPTIDATPTLSLTVEPRGDYLAFELQAPQGLPGDAYRLVDWRMVATRKDGTIVQLRGYDEVLHRADDRRAIVRTAGDSLHVIGAPFLSMHDSSSFHDIVGSYSIVGSANFDDVVSARLEGTIESYRMVEVDRFPLRNGLARLQDGRRAALTVYPADTAGPRIALRTKWLAGTTGGRALSFALVNPIQRALLPLRIADSDYHGMGSKRLGFGVMGYDYTFRPAIWTLPIPPVDSAWMAGAEFVVGAPVRAGTMRVSVAGVVTPDSAGALRRRSR
jgi:hypothetical protein